MNKIVIIDDERPVLLTLEALLKRNGYAVQLAATASAGLSAIEKFEPHLVLQDLGLPDAPGLETLGKIKQRHPDVMVIIITAQDSLSNAIESIKLGAYHFISKPYAPEELLNVVKRALEQRDLVKESAELRAKTEELSRQLEEAQQQLAPIFTSRRMREINELVGRVAPSDANVLITGESGVGKEVVANQIHRLSRRSDGPLVKLNCAAFPQNMIESELFGYVKGAFTGALNDFPGMIHEASGGTLFLDEIAEMPAELQTRFLRVLQEREYRPLGSTKTLKSDFRLVAATNRPIQQALSGGTLRQDLYYRLKTFQLEIPPLRERREDIPSLSLLFARRFATQMNKPEPQFSPDAFQFLMDYNWPGNVRELQNAIEHSIVLCEGGAVTVKHLPRELRLPAILQEAAVMHPANGGREDTATLKLDAREREAILQALAQCHGNKKKAAAVLGIHRPTLYSKMKRYGIELK
ncbi:MAG TPA: sigma-54 dependent transcriptional regulator [Chthoniobacteraceae bacterium]|jgi:DNA-binding NtrC family response regulator|nr:sigma-54 dependent transcriptional regulator [Chthoniobacteraceae bacterium]